VKKFSTLDFLRRCASIAECVFRLCETRARQIPEAITAAGESKLMIRGRFTTSGCSEIPPGLPTTRRDGARPAVRQGSGASRPSFRTEVRA